MMKKLKSLHIYFFKLTAIYNEICIISFNLLEYFKSPNYAKKIMLMLKKEIC